MLCRTRNRRNQATAANPTTKAISVADQQLRTAGAHALADRVKRVGQREQAGREHRGDGEQEAEPRGQFAIQSEEQARADRRAGARHTGHQRQALRQADDDAVLPGELLDWRVCLPKYSAAAMTTENTISAIAISQRLRAPVRISSLNSRPNTPIGMVPMMTYQPSQ